MLLKAVKSGRRSISDFKSSMLRRPDLYLSRQLSNADVIITYPSNATVLYLSRQLSNADP